MGRLLSPHWTTLFSQRPYGEQISTAHPRKAPLLFASFSLFGGFCFGVRAMVIGIVVFPLMTLVFHEIQNINGNNSTPVRFGCHVSCRRSPSSTSKMVYNNCVYFCQGIIITMGCNFVKTNNPESLHKFFADSVNFLPRKNLCARGPRPEQCR